MKRISIILILLSFYNCFTVYNGNKEVLKSELKESKKESEIKDIYIIKHNLNSKGLTIFMEGYKVNEETTILNFEEYYKVNKNFKWSEEAERIFEGQYKDARGAIGAAAMGLIVLAIELPTLPVRLIPEEESQERQETKKKITSHLEKLNNNGMIFDIGDKEFIATGIFQNNKTFIPIKDLKIHSENYQKIYYKLSNSKEEILVMGEINFS
ncbi:MAG: hypothetical protein KDK36_07680, partial [Leptospiraceae bacterium]|nr:hypothetical protein [Leptospiraceae bacterium]